jgi:hypothetical protein
MIPANIVLQKQRRQRARSILSTQYDQYDMETSTTDLLTDLMHAAATSGVDFDNCLRVAQGHFEEESK